MSFADRYGPWAAVTGAGRGMGAAFAGELASRGVAVVLVDRDEEPLQARAEELRGDGADVRTVVLDLAGAARAKELLAVLSDLDLGLLVSNAAVPFVGPFLEEDLGLALAQVEVNCTAPLVLAHALSRRFVSRGSGGLIFISSQSAMRGTALSAVYAATKAWNLVLAESLWDELRGAGVDVLGVLPGPTRTPGFVSSAPQPGLVTQNMMEPAEVAREALDALGSVPSMVPGQANRDSEAFMGSLDRPEAIRIMGEVMRAAYPPDREPDPTI